MNSIILCEGETDQIIISYYFIMNFGFKPCEKLPMIAPKKLNPKNKAEKIYAYNRDDDNLIMWAVGGHEDVFEKALRSVLNRNKLNSPINEIYYQICIVTDHDSDEELNNFWQRINQCLKSYGIMEEVQSAKWVDVKQPIDFEDEDIQINLLGLPVPLDENGALEVLLLNAFNEKEYNSYIVKKSRDVIDDLLKNKDKFFEDYLSTRREQIKAPLAVFLAITAPEQTFELIDTMMQSVPWNEYKAIKEQFSVFNVFRKDIEVAP